VTWESRYGTDGLRDLDLFLDRAGIELASVDVEQGKAARDYALARVLGEPLLYRGDDFSRTDVITFVPPSSG
jgi:ribonuclease VapC